MELERMSPAALTSLNPPSKPLSSLNDSRRALISACVGVLGGVPVFGALLRINTFARLVFESPTASCLVSTPVRKRLTPAIETLLGNVTAPFNDEVLSASRPPHPV